MKTKLSNYGFSLKNDHVFLKKHHSSPTNKRTIEYCAEYLEEVRKLQNAIIEILKTKNSSRILPDF